MRGLLQESSGTDEKMFTQHIHGPRMMPELTKEELQQVRQWELGQFTFPPLLIDGDDVMVIVWPADDETIKKNIQLWKLLQVTNASQVVVRRVTLTTPERRNNMEKSNDMEREFQQATNPRRRRGPITMRQMELPELPPELERVVRAGRDWTVTEVATATTDLPPVTFTLPGGPLFGEGDEL